MGTSKDGAGSLFERAADQFMQVQDRIVEALEAREPEARFLRDDWTRDDAAEEDGPVLGGYGRTRVLEGGDLLEKGGVNFSCVHGRFSEEFARTMPGDGLRFRATGISLVLHPRSPMVPTVHMNYRRLSRTDDEGRESGWFGGGADLTPNYLFEQDVRHFHRTHRDACGRHPDVAHYSDFKKRCDDYFTIRHRGEMRGVGGIFFDYLFDAPEETFAFVQDAAAAFLPSWLPIADARREEPWGEEERQWQLLRRGRYVEFNLVWDRGTAFGLRTGGRIESILMSLPAHATWRYDHRAAPGSREAEMVAALQPRDWIGHGEKA